MGINRYREEERTKIRIDLLQFNLLPGKFVSDFSPVRSRLRLLIDSKRVCRVWRQNFPFQTFLRVTEPHGNLVSRANVSCRTRTRAKAGRKLRERKDKAGIRCEII